MLKRRDFLRATLITATTLLLPACGGEEIDEVTPPTTPPRKLTDGAMYFPQGLASGDPKPDSVILWARLDDTSGTGDLDIEVELATDADFKTVVKLDTLQTKLKALAKYDHCVKAKVKGLTAATTYYYRFIYVKGSVNYVSPVGRTKTAPAADADAKVSFAFVSCQDYIGRYYNTYTALAEENLDFFVHLGDYIYETTGDPSFQMSMPDRAISFKDKEGAIALSAGPITYYAAKSLDNYRQLYRTYRADKALQKVHMLFPMIATWDDHEYSDDCHGATATYTDGRQNEADEGRRKAANQAWFEYQPVDFEAGDSFVYDPSVAYPKDMTIYRDFEFGKHVHLVMTDLRTYRADHLIPEEAFPGTVFADKETLTAELGAVPALARPYIDVDAPAYAVYKQALTSFAKPAGYDPAKITGKLSVAFVNSLVTQLNMSTGMQIPPISAADAAKLDRGYSFLDLGKASFNTAIGARYFVVKDVFDVYGKLLYKKTAGASEDVMGKDQEAWFLKTMQGSKATWKVWGNEYCVSQLAVDLTSLPVPEQFQRQFYVNVDAWDGFRNKRAELLDKLSGIGGVVAVTGDIHACFAGTPAADEAGQKKIVEFVGSSIASGTLRAELKRQAVTDPVLSKIPGAALLIDSMDGLLRSKVNPLLGFADSGSNGYAVVVASGAEITVAMKLIDAAEVVTNHAAADLKKLVKEIDLKTVAGGADLYQQEGDTWKKWDPATQMYV